MCGICAVVSDSHPVDASVIQAMCNRLIHRGPDSEGIHVNGRVALGMRRLSIIDLEGGHQPIFNEDRSMAIVFNGEVYNYRELRAELLGKGHAFTTRSDTEVVLHLYEEYGVKAVERLRGMFAFVIHESATGRVFAARDRLGIKPLHYLETNGTLYMASELKGFFAIPGLSLALDEVALDQYFSLLYIPAPRTIFHKVKKLPPGHILVKDPAKPVVISSYWRLSSRPTPRKTEESWIEEFRVRFDDAVHSHLMADVPLGVFLSGGVDSSGIVAATARSAGGRVKTFSVGFPAEYADFDELRYARRVAELYGGDHEELVVQPDIREAIYTLGKVFDEPMGDSGAVPNYLVCKMARQRLVVALSGLGGDELCGGYQRHLGVLMSEWYRKIPRWFRDDVVRRVIDLIPESRKGLAGIDRAKRFARSSELPWIERFFAFASPIDRARREALYSPEFRRKVQLDSALERMRDVANGQVDADLLNKVLSIDLQTYMVDDLLAVADRVSMAVSLEVRVPFLDHPLVELMANVPGALKIHRFETKHLLKRAFASDLPPEILHHRKTGFSLPVARWLREDLRELLEEFLPPRRLLQQGYFEPGMVETLKQEHFARRRNNSSVLWGLLMFQIWLDNYGQRALSA